MKYTIQHIKDQFQRKKKIKFLFFWGHTAKEKVTKACFSQWYPAKI